LIHFYKRMISITLIIVAILALGQTQRLRERGGPRFNEEINGLDIFARVEGSSILRGQGPLGSRVGSRSDESRVTSNAKRTGSLQRRPGSNLNSWDEDDDIDRRKSGNNRRKNGNNRRKGSNSRRDPVGFGSLGSGQIGFSGFETRGRDKDRFIGNQRGIPSTSEGLWFFSDKNATLTNLLKRGQTAREFVALIERGEVEEILSQPNNYTIFLPAGPYLGAKLGGTPISNMEKSAAKNLVLRHVISERLERDQIPVGLNMFETLGGTTLMILKGKRFDFLVDVTSDEGDGSIKVFNIRAKNGVVHIIDGVL